MPKAIGPNPNGCADDRGAEIPGKRTKVPENQGLSPSNLLSGTFRMFGTSVHGQAGQEGPQPPDSPPTDPRLARVNEAWDRLPEAIRAAIDAMIRAAKGGR
jgi:hypothetical protein